MRGNKENDGVDEEVKEIRKGKESRKMYKKRVIREEAKSSRGVSLEWRSQKRERIGGS